MVYKLSSISKISLSLLLGTFVFSAVLEAKNIDLTKDYKPDTKDLQTKHWNLGPTGLRGWFYRENHRTTSTNKARQILITEVAPGSPAEKDFKVGDVILGVSGDGNSPQPFSSDARITFGKAIGAAEARKPATLSLIQWRGGQTRSVSLNLQTLGAYSKTAPYNCPKSKRILEQGLDHLMTVNHTRGYGFNSLALLASNDPENPKNAERQAKAKEVAHGMIMSDEHIKKYTSGEVLTDSKITWRLGHELLALAEYYGHTGDNAVLPTLRAMAIQYSNGQSMFGTTGHQLAKMGKNGSIHGPYGVGYGALNSANMPAWLGLTIADKAGVTAPEIKPAIERARRFYSSFVDQGAIGYGEHAPHFTSHSNNGKNGLAAITYGLLGERYARDFFGMMAGASVTERDIGHQGPFFNFTWEPLGANAIGGHALSQYFGELAWRYDLSRRWDGSFSFDAYNKTTNGSKPYNQAGFEMAASTLLTYAAPLRQIYITGKELDRKDWIDSRVLPEIKKASLYNAKDKTLDEALADISNWSPIVRNRAADRLRGFRLETDRMVSRFSEMLKSPKHRYEKYGALSGLGGIFWQPAATGDLIIPLLTDEDHVVRALAARAINTQGHQNYLNEILKACVSTWRPASPICEHDPVNFAHYYLCLKLFYFGGNYGTPGLLNKHDLVGVDRSLLIPAIRAAAKSHIGLTRSAVGATMFGKLTEEEFRQLSDVIVNSVEEAAPADRMFSSGVRKEGLSLLQRFGYEEGITLAQQLYEEQPKIALEILKKYGSDIKASSKQKDIIDFIEFHTEAGRYQKQAKEILAKVTSDIKPRQLKTLNQLSNVTAQPQKLKTSTGKTTLTAEFDHNLSGDPIFTWKKIHGAGAVTFSPDSNAEAATTTASFDGKPGKYLFEVSYRDASGLTTLTKQVGVMLTDSQGKLPRNAPPIAKSSTLETTSGSPLSFKLPASDPEGYALNVAISNAPSQGTFTPSGDQWIYTADVGFTGKDQVSYQVTDSEGQTKAASLTFNVSPLSKLPVALYEPFAYTQKKLDQATGTHEIGFAEPWVGHPHSSLGSKSHTFGKLPTKGGAFTPDRDAGALVGSRRIHPDALKNRGLLDDGKTLWISVIIGTDVVWHKRVEILLANRSIKADGSHNFIEEDPNLDFEGVGIGFNGRYQAIATSRFGESVNTTEVPPRSPGVSLKQDRLLVAKCTWGAEEDIIEVYRPDENLRLPAQPVFITKTKVNQSLFDTLTIFRVGKIRIDEIRMGDSYQSILQGNTPME